LREHRERARARARERERERERERKKNKKSARTRERERERERETRQNSDGGSQGISAGARAILAHGLKMRINQGAKKLDSGRVDGRHGV